MKIINLSSLINSRIGLNHDRPALVGKNQNLSFGNLIDTPSAMHGKKIILFIDDTLTLVKCLVSFDGSAQAICPISTEISKGDLSQLVSKNEFDAAISDLSEEYLDIFADVNIPVFKINEISFTEQPATRSIQQNTAWLIPTSGTTSVPKLVSHTLASLAKSSLRRKKLSTKSEVWGQFYDLTRYAGYQTLLNSLLNAHTLVAFSQKISIEERIVHCAEERVTHISATPSQWRKILMTGEYAKRIPLEHIVLGGEAADQQILDALSHCYPEAKITHTYASTEAGMGLYVSDGLAGFPKRFLDSPEGFSEAKISDGRLFLRTLSSASHYVDGNYFKDKQGWIDTCDLVRVQEERFFVIGRESGIINIGGDKVNPENVRQTLLKHPYIAQAYVYGKKNQITGMVLAADIQLKGNVSEELAKTSIKFFIKEKLQSKNQPRLVKYVNDINLDITGKLRGRR